MGAALLLGPRPRPSAGPSAGSGLLFLFCVCVFDGPSIVAAAAAGAVVFSFVSSWLLSRFDAAAADDEDDEDNVSSSSSSSSSPPSSRLHLTIWPRPKTLLADQSFFPTSWTLIWPILLSCVTTCSGMPCSMYMTGVEDELELGFGFKVGFVVDVLLLLIFLLLFLFFLSILPRLVRLLSVLLPSCFFASLISMLPFPPLSGIGAPTHIRGASSAVCGSWWKMNWLRSSWTWPCGCM